MLHGSFHDVPLAWIALVIQHHVFPAKDDPVINDPTLDWDPLGFSQLTRANTGMGYSTTEPGWHDDFFIYAPGTNRGVIGVDESVKGAVSSYLVDSHPRQLQGGARRLARPEAPVAWLLRPSGQAAIQTSSWTMSDLQCPATVVLVDRETLLATASSAVNEIINRHIRELHAIVRGKEPPTSEEAFVRMMRD